ncbi:MAG TPA: hypothetical protein VKX49_29390 [Bryobacteraceae bacterium]|nr:hypothetical protein [Bryobacteraceae bacterium]
MRKLECLAVCFGFTLFAALANGQDRPNFSGNWQFDASKSELHNLKMSDATWAIQEADNSIHLTLNESGKAVELKCTTDGKDCNASGEKAKASFWYNGPMLVEMETKGDHVIRYRLKLSDDGKTLRVETTSIVPKEDATDVLVFTKKS